MTKLNVRWPQLKGDFRLPTGETHRIIIERLPVYRLEIDDRKSTGGRAQAVEFSADDLWKELDFSHKDFAKNARECPFAPEAIAEGIDWNPAAGALMAGLRFADHNPRYRLLVVGHTEASATGTQRVLALLEGDRDSFVSACEDFPNAEAAGDYFDAYERDLVTLAGTPADLEALRGKLRFVSAKQKVLACGDRGIELLFFDPPDVPDPSDQRTPDLIYKSNLFKFRPVDGTAGEGNTPFALVDAPAPEPGVGDPAEPFETRMASLGEPDSADPWAFLEPLDATRPA